MRQNVKRPGPIERMLAQSDNPQLQRLCQMSNLELLSYMDELSDAGENLDATLYDAAEQLLDERAPIERPSAEEVIRAWESFKARHPEIHRPQTVEPAKPVKKTYTLRRCLAVAALVAVLTLGMTVGALAVAGVDFQDFGEVVMRNIKYGGSGQLENLDPLATGYASLAEAISQTGGGAGIESATWVPHDLSLTRVTAAENELGQYNYWAFYEADGRSLAIVICQLEGMPIIMEKNPDALVDTMRWHGSDYLIVDNSGYVNCEWDKGGYSYSAAGSITADELKSVVKSFK